MNDSAIEFIQITLGCTRDKALDVDLAAGDLTAVTGQSYHDALASVLALIIRESTQHLILQ